MTESLKKVACFILTLCALTFYSNSAQAEQGPSEVVKEAIAKVQAEGDPSPMVDYVDWSGVYAKMPEKSKELLKVKSEEELKNYYRNILKSPSEAMSSLMSSKMGEKMGPDKAKAGEQILAKLKERMQVKETEIKDKIKHSKYTVGDAIIDGDAAKVPVSYVYQDKTSTDTIELRKKDDVWMMSSLGEGFNMGSIAGAK